MYIFVDRYIYIYTYVWNGTYVSICRQDVSPMLGAPGAGVLAEQGPATPRCTGARQELRQR